MAGNDRSEPEAGAVPEGRGLLSRLRDVFFAPGRLGDELREHPRWLTAALVGAGLVMLGTALIPPEIWESMMRTELLSQGQPIPEGGVPTGNLFRIFGTLGGGVAWFVFTALFAGVFFLIFGFLFGDDIRYRQALSMVAHANVIPSLGTLLTVPLKIAREDPQLTLSVGTFLQGVLSPGFGLFLARGLDLFAIWGWVVAGILLSRLDERRSPASAVVVVTVVGVCVVALLALVQSLAPA